MTFKLWSQVLYPETYCIYGTLSSFPVQYASYCVAHYRPRALYTSFISVNHIRLHATCSCYLVLMVTAVMRGEMREWWMVIVVLLLLNVWLGTVLLVPSWGVRGSFEFTWRCQCIAASDCCNQNKQPGLGFCVLITRHFMLHFDLIRIKCLFFSGALKQMGWREVWANTHVFSCVVRCLLVCTFEGILI